MEREKTLLRHERTEWLMRHSNTTFTRPATYWTATGRLRNHDVAESVARRFGDIAPRVILAQQFLQCCL